MKKVLATLALVSPVAAFAAGATKFILVNEWITSIGAIINTLVPIVFTLAVLGFFWGLATYIFSAGDSEKKENGKNIMIYGVIALFVMSSVWGIVKFIGTQLGISNDGSTSTITIPTVKVN